MIGHTYVWIRRRVLAERAQLTYDRSRGGSTMPVGVIAAIAGAVGFLAGAFFF